MYVCTLILKCKEAEMRIRAFILTCMYARMYVSVVCVSFSNSDLGYSRVRFPGLKR